jgi:hypothetical protein
MASQCAHWVEEQQGLRASTRDVISKVLPFKSKTADEISYNNQIERGAAKPSPNRSATGILKPFHKSSIRRVDTEPRKINPSGHISERVNTLKSPSEIVYEVDNASRQEEGHSPHLVFDSPKNRPAEFTDSKIGDQNLENVDTFPIPSTSHALSQLSPSISRPEGSARVGFVPSQSFSTGVSATQRTRNLRQRGATTDIPLTRTFTEIDISLYFCTVLGVGYLQSSSGPRQRTLRPVTSYNLPQVEDHLISQHSIGLGGFPGPIELLRRLGRLTSARLGKLKDGKFFRPSPSILLPLGQATPGQLERYDTKEVCELLGLR